MKPLFFYFIFIYYSFFTLSCGAYIQVKLPSGVVGPESFAFDCKGEGPYTGVADGRIFKWQGLVRGWIEFAVTAANRRRDLCDGSTDINLEPTCGRPLGLQFNNLTCELYIADAYFGLMKVGRSGGVAMQLASSAEGVPFNFTNGLDIDQQTGVVYFTDSSTRYQRRYSSLSSIFIRSRVNHPHNSSDVCLIFSCKENLKITLTGDSTGRFMKYDSGTGQLTVLLRGLKFPNGVALSSYNNYVIVEETSIYGILRYWLKGVKIGQSENFSRVLGAPDNIRRNSRGEYWVGLNNGGLPILIAIAVRLDGEGRVLETLITDGSLESVSEVREINGILLVGSVGLPYVGLNTISVGALKSMGLNDTS